MKLEEIQQHPDIVKIQNSERLFDHIRKQEDHRLNKLTWKGVMHGIRSLVRPKLNWRNNLAADQMALIEKQANEVMINRDKWRQIVQSSKNLIELQCYVEKQRIQRVWIPVNMNFTQYLYYLNFIYLVLMNWFRAVVPVAPIPTCNESHLRRIISL